MCTNEERITVDVCECKIEDMYEGMSTKVRSLSEKNEDFSVSVGVHQGFVLCSYIFFLVIDEIIKYIYGEVCTVVYAVGR